MSRARRRPSFRAVPYPPAADRVGRPAGIVRIGDPLEDAGPRPVDLGDHLAVHRNNSLPDDDARPRFLQLGETPHVDLVTHQAVEGADLAAEDHLPAAQRPPRAERAPPDTVESQELPDGVHPKTAGLNRVAGHVALEVPGVETNLLLGDDPPLPAVPRMSRTVHHQKGRGRKAGDEILRRIVYQIPVGNGNELLQTEVGTLFKLVIGHDRFSTASSRLTQVRPAPTRQMATRSPRFQLVPVRAQHRGRPGAPRVPKVNHVVPVPLFRDPRPLADGPERPQIAWWPINRNVPHPPGRL